MILAEKAIQADTMKIIEDRLFVILDMGDIEIGIALETETVREIAQETDSDTDLLHILLDPDQGPLEDAIIADNKLRNSSPPVFHESKAFLIASFTNS